MLEYKIFEKIPNDMTHALIDDLSYRYDYIAQRDRNILFKTIIKSLNNDTSLTKLYTYNIRICGSDYDKCKELLINSIINAINNNKCLNLLSIDGSLAWNILDIYNQDHAIENITKLEIACTTGWDIPEDIYKGLTNNIKNNKILTSLSISCYNYYATNYIAEILKHNNYLKSISLHRFSPNSQSLKNLLDSIKSNECLQKISIINSNINPINSIDYIGKLLTTKSKIKVFKFIHCSSTYDSCILSNKLHYDITCETLIIKCKGINYLGKGIIKFANSLSKNKTLKFLTISEYYIWHSGAMALANSLKYNKTLISLKLTRNKILLEDKYNDSINFSSIIAIADSLDTNNTLTSLSLNYQEINYEIAIYILGKLKYIKFLELNGIRSIGNNKISEKFGNSIEIFLKHNKVLESLKMRYSQLNVNHIINISNSLKNNNKIRKLCLSANIFGSKGTNFIFEALLTNNSITYLDLERNNIDSSCSSSISNALKVNNNLTFLNLNDNNIDSTCLVSISEALIVNKSLSTLFLGMNKIGNDGIASITKAIKHNNTLVTLDLRDNNITGKGAMDNFIKKVRKYSAIEHIYADLFFNRPIKEAIINRLTYRKRKAKGSYFIE